VKTTDKDAGQLKLRLPEDLKDDLKAAAVANDRSLNGEIVNRLRTTFRPKKVQTKRPTLE
jgi:predicted HicB family RNase H-like nuclease